MDETETLSVAVRLTNAWAWWDKFSKNDQVDPRESMLSVLDVYQETITAGRGADLLIEESVASLERLWRLSLFFHPPIAEAVEGLALFLSGQLTVPHELQVRLHQLLVQCQRRKKRKET